ncbi:MAG: hypothetical protein BMS9Abin18_0402 [Zetaproteobacteria bacterium]|nr:MAG: hypothetical protein BMS9Abin18_0402 [Zetaproteobacteria bacterium]
MSDLISPVRHGLLLAVTAMVFGVSWAAYLATHHEDLHGGFEKQEAAIKAGNTPQQMKDMDMQGMSLGAAADILIRQAHAHGQDEAPNANHGNHDDALAGAKHQHSHSGSLAKDAMQRLLRGHIHWMGLGILSAVMLLIVAFTSLKSGWKKTLGWTFGIGALAYPVSWILMGFRTVTMGPEAAEASVMWLFGPAAGLLLASLVAVFGILLLEMAKWHTSALFSRFFELDPVSGE